MRCSGCGKDVPFAGEVCPYCQRDKSSDQAASIAAGIGMVIGGLIGSAVAGFGGMIVGGLVLGVIATVVSLAGGSHSAKQPARVRIDPPSPMPRRKGSNASGTVEDRLRRLDKMKAEGLLTDHEHQAQRAAIVASI